MSDISPSAIKTGRPLEERISKATSQAEIEAILHEEAVSQGLVRRDIYDPSVLIPTDEPQPHRFAKSIEVGGVKRIFEGDSEVEVEREVNAFLTQQMTPTETRTEVTRDDAGRFVSQAEQQRRADENVVDKIHLELRFKRGEISTAEYLEKSGAIEQHLESMGIPVEDLKAAVQEKADERFTGSWASATQEFLHSPEGSSWPGGQENMKQIGEILNRMGLVDAENKFAALASAYQYMQQNGMVGENRELTAHKRISEATSVEEIRRAASSLFGR